ncbi:MAG: ribonuclease P protein component [Alphaproteobacteria bacterium]|nr:ribonuclease P protein component [Alphaproteobacteria bacterium]
MHTSKAQLKRIDVIRTRADFLTIQGKGRKWVSRGLILQVKSNDTGTLRVGFTVSKKISKSAVVRNRIKRRLRAVAADVLSISAKRGVDYILVGRVETATKPYETLCHDLIWCLKKTGFYEATEAED